jgi:hypothetical protein
MTVVAGPASFRTSSGQSVDGNDIDMVGRMMSMQKTHKTYALTGALCTAAAAVIDGTVVHSVLHEGFDQGNLRIGHPGGLIQVGVETERGIDGNTVISWAYGFRTARLLMRGTAYYR